MLVSRYYHFDGPAPPLPLPTHSPLNSPTQIFWQWHAIAILDMHVDW